MLGHSFSRHSRKTNLLSFILYCVDIFSLRLDIWRRSELSSPIVGRSRIGVLAFISDVLQKSGFSNPIDT